MDRAISSNDLDEFSMTHTDVEEDDFNEKITAKFVAINTNARSLCPKVNSLLDCFTEMNVSVGIITETWLNEGSGLQEDVDHFVNGTGFGLLNLCRQPTARGVAHGGVSIAFRKNTSELNQIHLSNPEEFEVLVSAGSLRGHAKKLVVLSLIHIPSPRD